jgi:ribonuclease HII
MGRGGMCLMSAQTLTLKAWAERIAAGPLSRQQRAHLMQDTRAGAQVLYGKYMEAQAKAAQEQRRLRRLQVHERALWAAGCVYVAGVDEVGVGPLAGPVLAAAVILPAHVRIVGMDDSKKVPRAKREALAQAIAQQAVGYAIGSCSVLEIDAMNIFRAAREAMRRAVVALNCPCEHVLVDAHRIYGVRMQQTAIIGGDGVSHSIAAASLIAKVTRDRIMVDLDARYPGYGLAQHMGYGTAQHLQALARLGPTPAHRRSFAPVRMAWARSGA